jgi:hypothetical protein
MMQAADEGTGRRQRHDPMAKQNGKILIESNSSYS